MVKIETLKNLGNTGRLGVNISTKYQSLPLDPKTVFDRVSKLKQYLNLKEDISCVKFFDYDHSIIDLIEIAAANPNILEICLGIPNDALHEFNDENMKVLEAVVNQIKWRVRVSLAIGNDPSPELAADISNVLQLVKKRIPDLRLTIPFGMRAFMKTWPVERSVLKPEYFSAFEEIINYKIDFFTLNAYSFFAEDKNIVPDHLYGANLIVLKNMINAVRTALAKAFSSRCFEIQIGETGWPSRGSHHAKIESSFTFFSNASHFIESATRSGGIISRGYLYELLDEDLRSSHGGAEATSFGIFTSDGQQKM